MTAFDTAFGFLAGVVSCLTPESLLLFPLVMGAAGAVGRASIVALAIGLGMSLIVTGALAGAVPGFDAISFRRVVCAVLLMLGIVLMSPTAVQLFPRLTGGLGSMFSTPGTGSRARAARQMLLALLVGANWIPRVGPTLGKASLMAAGELNFVAAFEILFVFGMGAAIPWIVLGRVIRFFLRPAAGRALGGMAGKRFLGLTLLAVAILGGSGLDVAMTHWLDALLPPWTRKLALAF